MDRFYTPTQIANRMVQSVSLPEVSLVADFAAGQGELIKVARSRWPNAICLATDINRNTVSRLRRAEIGWRVGRCDFLNFKSRERCEILASALGKVSLILMNPPFSCRGARKYEVKFEGSVVRCGLALAFVLESLRFLAVDGQLIALLPAGCFTAVKDKQAWEALRRSYRIERFGKNGSDAFDECHAETVIVSFTARKRILTGKPLRRTIESIARNGHQCKTVRLFRGKVPMYLAKGEASDDAMTLIHTTELERGTLNLYARKVENKWKAVRGPAVLLPRVGQPSSHKIKLYLRKEEAVLSDCVIALRCATSKEARNLQTLLRQNWNLFKREYGGTCAKYITIDALRIFVESLGVGVEMDKPVKGKHARWVDSWRT